MRTIEIGPDTVSVQITEFEMMALAALVERGQGGLSVNEQDSSCIGLAIDRIALEFRSLLGHFELVEPETS